MKGFVKTLESALAVALIFISIIFLFDPQPRPEPQISDKGYKCLRYLDNKGILGYYAANSLESDLINDLRECLPPILNYTAKICKTVPCTTILPDKKTIFLSSYFIAGDDSVDSTLINLWIWSS